MATTLYVIKNRLNNIQEKEKLLSEQSQQSQFKEESKQKQTVRELNLFLLVSMMELYKIYPVTILLGSSFSSFVGISIAGLIPSWQMWCYLTSLSIREGHGLSAEIVFSFPCCHSPPTRCFL